MRWDEQQTTPIDDIRAFMREVLTHVRTPPAFLLLLPSDLHRRYDSIVTLVRRGWSMRKLDRLKRRARTKLNHAARRKRRRDRIVLRAQVSSRLTQIVKASHMATQQFRRSSIAVDEHIPPWTPPRRFPKPRKARRAERAQFIIDEFKEWDVKEWPTRAGDDR